MARAGKLEAFDFRPGRVIGAKYVVDERLGTGWEGEVYRVTERRTGIVRAAKVFYPHRNIGDRVVRYHARKLESLRDCPILIQYHHSESFWHRGFRVTCLISELVEGERLETFVARQRGKRLASFEALHLLHTLAAGMERVHLRKDYHGDIHDRNVLVRRRGIGFEVKLLDFYHHGRPTRDKMQEDVIQLVRLLYDAVGGQPRYGSQPPEVKAVCCGLRRDLITSRFPTAGHLRAHLESFDWSE